jgi:hypothetical protein
MPASIAAPQVNNPKYASLKNDPSPVILAPMINISNSKYGLADIILYPNGIRFEGRMSEVI